MDGECEDECERKTCNPGFQCQVGVCVEDPCFNVLCDPDQVCLDGNCIFDGCQEMECPQGEQCGRSGCEPLGSCGGQVCAEGELCRQGVCVDPNVENNNDDPDGQPGAQGSDDSCGCRTTAAPAPLSRYWVLVLAVLLVSLLPHRRCL